MAVLVVPNLNFALTSMIALTVPKLEHCLEPHSLLVVVKLEACLLAMADRCVCLETNGDWCLLINCLSAQWKV